MKINFSTVIGSVALALICFIAAAQITVNTFVSGATASRLDIATKEANHLLSLKQLLDQQQLAQAQQQVATQLASAMDELRGYRSYASTERKQEIDQLFRGVAQYRQQLLASPGSDAAARVSWQGEALNELLDPVQQALDAQADQKQ